MTACVADLPARQEWQGGLNWPGSTVVIMASGPSLTSAQAERVREWRGSHDAARVIVLNTTFLLAPWADVLYACDAGWWRHYLADVRATFRGDLWSQAWQRDRKEALVHESHGVRWVASKRVGGLNRAPGVLHTGSGSGFQAINLAYMAGARRVILLGYDMRRVGGRAHHHVDHPPPLNSGLPFDLWIKELHHLAPEAAAAGLDVINCTPGSALTAFPTMDLHCALALDDHE